MSAEIETPVSLTAQVPGGTAVTAQIGSFSVSVRDDAIHLADVYRALGELLIEAGQYMTEQGALPNP